MRTSCFSGAPGNNMRVRFPKLLAVAAVLLLDGSLALAQAPPATGQFRVEFDKAGITSFKFVGDKFDTDYIADEADRKSVV